MPSVDSTASSSSPPSRWPLPRALLGRRLLLLRPGRADAGAHTAYGTIITKNYPDDESSALDTPGRFRVNIHVGQGKADPLVAADAQPTDVDVFQPHPLYGTAGWVCVIDPAARTSDTVLALLRDAHESARARADRRARRG